MDSECHDIQSRADQSSRPPARKRQRVSVACRSCRTRKSRVFKPTILSRQRIPLGSIPLLLTKYTVWWQYTVLNMLRSRCWLSLRTAIPISSNYHRLWQPVRALIFFFYYEDRIPTFDCCLKRHTYSLNQRLQAIETRLESLGAIDRHRVLHALPSPGATSSSVEHVDSSNQVVTEAQTYHEPCRDDGVDGMGAVPLKDEGDEEEYFGEISHDPEVTSIMLR